MISDEREWSDEQNRLLNDGTARDEIGYDHEIPMESAHSKRSRHMIYEYNHQWDD